MQEIQSSVPLWTERRGQDADTASNCIYGDVLKRLQKAEHPTRTGYKRAKIVLSIAIANANDEDKLEITKFLDTFNAFNLDFLNTREKMVLEASQQIHADETAHLVRLTDGEFFQLFSNGPLKDPRVLLLSSYNKLPIGTSARVIVAVLPQETDHKEDVDSTQHDSSASAGSPGSTNDNGNWRGIAEGYWP